MGTFTLVLPSSSPESSTVAVPSLNMRPERMIEIWMGRGWGAYRTREDDDRGPSAGGAPSSSSSGWKVRWNRYDEEALAPAAPAALFAVAFASPSSPAAPSRPPDHRTTRLLEEAAAFLPPLPFLLDVVAVRQIGRLDMCVMAALLLTPSLVLATREKDATTVAAAGGTTTLTPALPLPLLPPGSASDADMSASVASVALSSLSLFLS